MSFLLSFCHSSLFLQEHFEDCDFENATQIGAAPHSSSRLSVDYRLENVGQMYFASEANCNSTPPLKLVVKVLHTGKLLHTFRISGPGVLHIRGQL